ncbi:MAG TPA: amino acid ABC transporter permease [Pseudolabrys sp.]|jgi:general L-amino acid transport system permease protein
MPIDLPTGSSPARVAFYNDPKVRSIAYQVALCAVIGFLVYGAVRNAVDNLERAHIASGFGFWSHTAGFDISQTLISFSSATSSYGRAFWVGLLNTLLVAGLGIVFASVLGFIIGIARLSKNWLVAKVAGGYVETIRNLPLLLQLLFWYNAVLKALPEMRESFVVRGGIFLNNRGLFIPQPIFKDGFGFVLVALAAGIVGAIAFYVWARKRQERTGQQAPVFSAALALVFGLPLVTLALAGFPLGFDYPVAGRFNINGGIEVLPEFAALLFGLSIYTAAFIAEVVRAGITAVSRGQTEAAYSLGLKAGPTLRLIVMPQAMRVIIPPLTSQYLNLTKNSTLAVAIGYPDLVQVFTGTVLNQTGQAVEVVAITMAVYLTISLATSLLMNIYNSRIALVER